MQKNRYAKATTDKWKDCSFSDKRARVTLEAAALVGPQGTVQGHRGEVAADPSLLRYIPEEPRAASISQTSYGLSWKIGEVEVQHGAGVRQRRNYNPQSGKRPGLELCKRPVRGNPAKPDGATPNVDLFLNYCLFLLYRLV